MATHITPQQLKEVRQMASNGATPKDVWEKLASYDDAYAQAAVKVFRPTSQGWYTVRAIWDITNADMSKFNNVAQTHMNQYLEMIQPDGKLPNSAQIEDSYVRALEKHGLSAKTAIDVVVSKIQNSGNSFKDDPITIPWYSTPTVVWLEKEREVPSYQSVLDKISLADARKIYEDVRNVVIAHNGRELMLDTVLKSWTGDRAKYISPQIGVTFYANRETGNWAIYDKNGEGAVFINGKEELINKHNFKINSKGEGEFLRNGKWEIVQLSPIEHLVPNQINERVQMASLNNSTFNTSIEKQNQDFIAQGFAALLSDNPQQGMNQMLNSDYAKTFDLQAKQVLTQDEAQKQQELAQVQEVSTPRMVRS